MNTLSDRGRLPRQLEPALLGLPFDRIRLTPASSARGDLCAPAGARGGVGRNDVKGCRTERRRNRDQRRGLECRHVGRHRRRSRLCREYARRGHGSARRRICSGSAAGPRGTFRATALVGAIAGAVCLALALGGGQEARSTERRQAWSWRIGPRAGLVSASVFVFALVIVMMVPGWDHQLLASGAYKYAPYLGSENVDAVLRAGDLEYYKEGAAATVSVRRLTGTTSLAIDGKVDASNSGDMLTQRMLGLLPVLLHGRAQDIAVIGLGSGVTVGSALARRRRAARRRHRDFARGRRGVALLRSRERRAARQTGRAADRRRRPIPSAADAAALRRDRVRAVESVDGRRRVAVHARVLRSGARALEDGWAALPVGAYLRHRQRGPALDRQDVRLGVSRRDAVDGGRRRSAADRTARGDNRGKTAGARPRAARAGGRGADRCRYRGRDGAFRAAIAICRRAARARALRR